MKDLQELKSVSQDRETWNWKRVTDTTQKFYKKGKLAQANTIQGKCLPDRDADLSII